MAKLDGISKSIRIFAVGFIVMWSGIGANKLIGFVEAGVAISFLGFAICVFGGTYFIVANLIKLLRQGK